MTGSSSAEILFSWVHLSDIHAGHGSTTHGWDQKRVLARLRQDIELCVKDPQFPRTPDAVLITGDMAFSGGGQRRGPGEYTVAAAWLDEIRTVIGRDRDRIYMVPGNHDVDRGVDRDGNIKRLVDDIRARGPGALDAELAKRKERGYLAKRMAAYLDFAAPFAPVSAPEGTLDRRRHPLFWTHVVPSPRLASLGLELHLAGLDTVLVGGRTDDEGRLQIGKQQLEQCLPERSDRRVVLALSHHPVSWLADAGDVGRALHARAHVHLCGHVHHAGTAALRRGGGRGLVTITAGAVHADETEEPVGHGYSFGALCLADEELVVRVWPRTWDAKGERFVPDTSHTETNRLHAEHRLDFPLPRNPGGSRAEDPGEPERGPGGRTTAASAEMRAPASTPAGLSRVLLILDRTQQWERLVNRCMQAREHLAFLVHGDAAQDVGAFVHRVEQYLEEASQLPHRTWRVPLRSDGLVARTVADWDLHLRRATGFARLSLADALARSAQNERLLLIFAEEPLKNLNAEQAAALVEFLRSRLPEQLRQAKPRHPVHLVIAVEHAGQRTPAGDDPLVATIDAALHGAPGLDLEPLIELTFPTWQEVKAQIRQELGPLATSATSACRERYEAVAAHPGRSYRLLAGALAEILEALPEAP
jgi:predicted MPP superfamily phosphohydrolase